MSSTETSLFSELLESLAILFRTKQMFGYGFGLPICRLYAQMFAGTLNLHQVSHIGTDAYLRLGFIHTPSEQIKI